MVAAMFLKALSIIAGIVILSAATHITIMHTGGYSDDHAYLTGAIALGVAIGALTIGSAWGEKRRMAAIFIGVALICGELFGLSKTAERLVEAREAKNAPLRAQVIEISKAERRLEDAKRELESFTGTSPRLESALAAKRSADQAVVEQASLRGCRKNCRALLQAQVDTANNEIEAARKAIAAERGRLQSVVTTARSELEALPQPKAAGVLAKHLGIEPWLYDLMVAMLGAISANGLAAAFLFYGAHGKPREKPAEVPEQPVDVLPPVQFLSERMNFSDGAKIEVNDIYAAYRAYCETKNLAPEEGEPFIKALESIIAECKLKVSQANDNVFIHNIKIEAA